MNDVFDTVQENAVFFREVSPSRNQKAYVLTCLCPQRAFGATEPTLTSAWLHVDTQGGFLCREIAGSAQGPVDANGKRKLSSCFTSFPMPGTSTAGGFAERGLRFQAVDAVTGLNVTTQYKHFTSADPWGDVNNILAPGYALGPYLKPLPFQMFLPQGAIIRFDFQNWDIVDNVQTAAYHRIDITLTGERYVGN